MACGQAGEKRAVEPVYDAVGRLRLLNYDGDRLAAIAFDTQHRGAPDRRLTYAASQPPQ